MHTCPECGNHDMRARVIDGATVNECGLCGARFGDRQAIAALSSRGEAQAAGVDPDIWPLVKVLRQVPELIVDRSHAGSTRAASLPRVELLVGGAGALVQIENLAKSLRLAAGSLRCPWGIEVGYELALTFVIGARAQADGPNVRDARIDVEVLAAKIDRDRRLSWWRHANGGPTG